MNNNSLAYCSNCLPIIRKENRIDSKTAIHKIGLMITDFNNEVGSAIDSDYLENHEELSKAIGVIDSIMDIVYEVSA